MAVNELKKRIVLCIILSVFCFTGCAKEADSDVTDSITEETSETEENPVSESELQTDKDKGSDADTDTDEKSLGERLQGCWFYVDESDPSEGYVFEITDICGNLFGASAYCLENDEGGYEICGVTRGYELIPLETGAFDRTDTDGCDIGLTMYDLINNAGRTYTSPTSCYIGVTDDGIVLEGKNGEKNPVTEGNSKANMKPSEEHLIGFFYDFEIKPEKCEKPSEELYGLWKMKDSDLFIRFSEGEDDPYEGKLNIYQKTPGKVPFVATGVFYCSGDEIICGYRRIGSYPDDFKLSVKQADGDRLITECEDSTSGLFDGRVKFFRADEEEVPPLTIEDAPQKGEGEALEEPFSDYYEIVSNADPNEWDAFKLIDLDGNGTPELFATCISGKRDDPGIQPYMVVGQGENGIVVNDELQDGVAGAGGYRGSLYYIEGKGKIYDSAFYAPFGEPADTIYILDNGEIKTLSYGYFEADRTSSIEDEDWDLYEHGEWKWNDKVVTEEEYKKKYREAIDNTEGLPMSEIEYIDRDSMLEELKEY